MSKKDKKKSDRITEDEKYPLPIYKKEDDIYSREKEEPFEEDGIAGETKSGSQESDPGEDLDVPGAELDDADEEIGEEDEENNYYSLGGDDHDDLEEDRGN